MPSFTRPPAPEISFGVWDRYGRPVQEDGRGDTFNVGWRIFPRYYGNTSQSFASREAAEPYLAREVEYHQRNMRSQMISMLKLPDILTGLEISSIDWIRYAGFNINLARGGHIEAHFRRQYWQTASVTMPDTGPFVVKRMLKTGKTIRLENGESITLHHYGPLLINNVPDWLLEELFNA